jgi:hypothetical protein
VALTDALVCLPEPVCDQCGNDEVGQGDRAFARFRTLDRIAASAAALRVTRPRCSAWRRALVSTDRMRPT